MTTPSKDASIRRSATRAPVGRPIKLQFDDSMDVIEGLCRNVSIGGMFISFENSRPAGSLVRFELELDESNAIRGLGEVVWMKSKSDFGGPESGFGLKFRFLEQRDRQMIFKLVSQHIKERLSKREPEIGDAAAPTFESELPVLDVAVPPSPAPSPLEASADLTEDAAQSADLTEDVPKLAASQPGASEPPLESSPLESPRQESPPLESSPPESPRQESPPFESSPLESPPVDTSPVATGAEFELAPPTRSESEPSSAALLPALDEMSAAELEAAGTSQAPAGPVGLDPIDLDPSVGQTPMYELGLESESTSSVDKAPARDSLGFGGGEAERDTVEDTDLRPHDNARGEVWGEPVARTGRQFSLLPVVVVILIAIAAAAFLFKDELAARFGSDPPASVASGGPAPAAAGGLSPGGVEAPTAGAPSAAADPETTTPSTLGDASSAGSEPTGRPPTLPPTPVTPPPPVPPPPVPPPPVAAVSAPVSTTSPSTTAATEAEFTRLVDIAWSDTAGGMKIILTGNGLIPTGRYSYFRLAGDSPREVVKLMGVDKRYPKDALAVGGPGVKQIRIGFHRAAGGHEIHVVMDLTDPRWMVSEVSNVGSSLELLLTKH